MVEDARYRTKVFLEAYLENENITLDNGETQATVLVCYANPPYPLTRLFSVDGKNVDVMITVDTPESKPMLDVAKYTIGYIEHIPVTINCVDKTGITATNLRWKAETELRRIVEEHPFGSLRIWSVMKPQDVRLEGSMVIHRVTYVLMYMRDTT